MTVRQQKALQRYVDRVKAMLGLTDYEVVVKREPPANPGHTASHKSVPGVNFSVLRFADGFFDLAAGDQRETVVHELVHCIFAPGQDQVRHILPDHLRGRAGEVFVSFWFQSHEYSVDRLSAAIHSFFPLPELP